MKKMFIVALLLCFPLFLSAQTRTDLCNIYKQLQNEDIRYFHSHNAFQFLMPEGYDPSTQPGYGGYGNNSSNSSSSSSSSSGSASGTLVGHYQAFGVSQAFGNNVTHNQSVAVYRDSHGYYILSHHLYGDVPSYLQSNSKSTYLGYSVGHYRYWVLDSGYNDITWFLNL